MYLPPSSRILTSSINKKAGFVTVLGTVDSWTPATKTLVLSDKEGTAHIKMDDIEGRLSFDKGMTV